MSEMLNKTNTNVERIIAKIDNDFNPDNSDWIPRVGAWCVDAMSQLDVLPTKRLKKKISVKDRIAYTDCASMKNNIKVYDSNGCEVKEASDEVSCNGCPSTGELASETSDTIAAITSNTISTVSSDTITPNQVVAETINDKYPYRYNVNHYILGTDISKTKNYVVIDENRIELNFDADYVYIEAEYIETSCSKMFGCDLPVIPNNGLLIEVIAYYCIYKMLCRGYNHPVFNLKASQYGTNPYYMWTTLKEEAKRSVINGNFDADSKLFRSNLFIETFDPRG